MAYVLVINSGSSSIKFQMIDPTASAMDDPLVSGVVEKIGERNGQLTIKTGGEKYHSERPIANHTGGLTLALERCAELGVGPKDVELVAVGHRVVHGGQVFSDPQVIDDQVVELIRAQVPLAPLHNPANIDGIEAMRQVLPDLPHVAVFDTAFFSDLPTAAAMYPIDRQVAEENQVRRYGFHGTSHEYVADKVRRLLEVPAEELNQITLHLGNGASAAAIRGGLPVDTSMGMTPLAGLMMGTRTGDIDPSIIFHLMRTEGMGVDEVDRLLNKHSGLYGVSGGYNDFREIFERVDQGKLYAIQAYDMYITQLRRFIGAYMVTLGNVDVISFTAGVGENAARVRKDALANLEMYGIEIDDELNEAENQEARVISSSDSRTKVMVVPTNEELAIARKCVALINA